MGMNQSEAKDINDNHEAPAPQDIREKTLALGFEITRRAALQKSFADLCLFLVNDLRAFIEFDRCFIIMHIGGSSRVVAMNHQPSIEKKSASYLKMNDLGAGIKSLGKGLLLSCDGTDCDFGLHGIADDVRSAVKAYIEFSKCSYFLSLPLVDRDQPVAHIVCEFFGDKPPHRLPVVAFIEAAPLLAPVLLEKWLLEQKPGLVKLLDPVTPTRKMLELSDRRLWIAGAVVLTFIIWLLFLFPIDYTVGGETLIVPWERHFAFCKIEGLIDKVLVKEGAHVKQGEVLADLDPKEIHFKIAKTEREIEIMARQIERLTREADKTPSKLGERKIAELERQKKIEELKFLKWQSQFLAIKAPTTGIIMTKDVDSLAGKKISAGEPFCEIAAHGELAAEVLVPDNKAAIIRQKQTVDVYLNNNPLKSYKLEVDEVAPSAEVMPRQGNVCRVKAKFPQAPESAMVGMTGIGKIHVEQTNLWSIISEAIALRWNQLSLYL
jgi:multidrug resistance efflux pump